MSSVQVVQGGQTATIDVVPGENLLALLRRGGFSVPAACGGRGKCGKCRVKLNGVPRLACKAVPADGDIVEPGGSTAAQILTTGRGTVTCTPGQTGLAAAVDLGTTTVALRLLDRATGKTLGERAELNAQAAYGADVITRMHYIMEQPDGLMELSARIRSQISAMLTETLKTAGCSAAGLCELVIAGNTVMEHICAGLSPLSIASAPFKPLSLFTEPVEDSLNGIPVRYAPCVAGYVGGDITAGLLAAGPAAEEGLQLFLDLGTNGEMALCGKTGITTCAVASGPAFEGAAIRCGMPGVSGAVSRVSYQNGFLYDIIGGGTATGICGSGLLDLVAVLLRLGAITRSGRLLPPEEAPDCCRNRLKRDENGNGRFYLTDTVYLTAEDVRSLQLAKAAVAGGIQVLLQNEGITPADIQSVQLAGGFGNFMNAESAIATGMLPETLKGKIKPVGNSALTGAQILALDRNSGAEMAALLKKTGYLELSGSAAFTAAFTENMVF